MNKFDPSIPRQMFWAKSAGDRSYCPECHSKLENESHEFIMAVREASDIHSLIVGNDAGYFCPKCPTVVLDIGPFRESAAISFGRDATIQFTVLGIVDLEAVPEEKRFMPLGEEGNPIPLVKFIKKRGTDTNPQRKAKARAKAKAKKKRRRGRKP